MKKILLTTNILTALALFTLMLTGCPAPEPTPETTKTCNTCEGSKLPSEISMDYFKSLLSTYRDNHWKTINSNLANRKNRDVDSRSVWFNLNELKGFINEIEKSVAHNCDGNHCDKQLGIRIYFGEYDNTTNIDYAGYHTLVMVPTMKNNNPEKWNTAEENVDFDYRFLTSCNPPTLDSTEVKLTALLPSIGSTTMGGMNHGGIIPPPDNVCTGAKFMDLVDFLDGRRPFCP